MIHPHTESPETIRGSTLERLSPDLARDIARAFSIDADVLPLSTEPGAARRDSAAAGRARRLSMRALVVVGVAALTVSLWLIVGG